jgi:hypothetical protein
MERWKKIEHILAAFFIDNNFSVDRGSNDDLFISYQAYSCDSDILPINMTVLAKEIDKEVSNDCIQETI